MLQCVCCSMYVKVRMLQYVCCSMYAVDSGYRTVTRRHCMVVMNKCCLNTAFEILVPTNLYAFSYIDLPRENDNLPSDDEKFKSLVECTCKIWSTDSAEWHEYCVEQLAKYVDRFASQMLCYIYGSTHLSIPESLGCRYFLDSSKPPPQAACSNCNQKSFI
jgi:hypothetical protein